MCAAGVGGAGVSDSTNTAAHVPHPLTSSVFIFCSYLYF